MNLFSRAMYVRCFATNVTVFSPEVLVETLADASGLPALEVHFWSPSKTTKRDGVTDWLVLADPRVSCLAA